MQSGQSISIFVLHIIVCAHTVAVWIKIHYSGRSDKPTLLLYFLFATMPVMKSTSMKSSMKAMKATKKEQLAKRKAMKAKKAMDESSEDDDDDEEEEDEDASSSAAATVMLFSG